MNVGDRSRVRLLDKLVKQGGWRSLCVVGVKDDLEAKSLGQWCRNLDLTVVWEQRDAKTRHERARQGRACDRMRKWAGIRKGLTLIEMDCDDAPAHLAGQQFDAVALWGLSPAQLAEDGAKWAALVRDGGALVGTGSRSPDVRGVLHAAVDKWRQLRDGVWLVDVKRTAPAEEFLAAGVGETNDHMPVVSEADDDAVGGQAHDSTTSDVAAAATIAHPAPKRRGGRPKGSRNKPKVATGA